MSLPPGRLRGHVFRATAPTQMSDSPVISIDAMGGDRGPQQVIAGLGRLMRRDNDTRFILHGDRGVLTPLLAKRPALAERCDLRHAPDIVRMDDKPARALRDRRESSMWQSLETVRAGEAAAAVSPGNTGALLAMSVFLLRKAPGVGRPAIAVHWPAERAEGYNTVLDVGADLKADPHHLAQYAVLGAEYARLSFGLQRPRVGLLNLGTEPTKGPEELRAAAQMIAKAAAAPGAGFDFIGFVEGAHIPTASVDVVVTDGFTGNVALKTAEGTARFIRAALREAYRSTWMSRFASIFAYTSLQRLRRRIDPRRVNGGVFLGLNGTVVKSHGDADAVGFAAALGLAVKMARSDFSAHASRQLTKLEPQTPEDEIRSQLGGA